jgi:hypothetical protein
MHSFIDIESRFKIIIAVHVKLVHAHQNAINYCAYLYILYNVTSPSATIWRQ